MLSQTNINQSEKYFKKAIELGLSMDMDLAVAKLNLAGVAMSRRRKLEATNLQRSKRLDKQGMLKEQITMMKGQMKKYNIKRQIKSFAFLLSTHQGKKTIKIASLFK
jgi:hypothetical protein